jgi:hypothetical protein
MWVYKGTPTTILNGNVRPSDAVIDNAALALGNAMRIAVGAAI